MISVQMTLLVLPMDAEMMAGFLPQRSVTKPPTNEKRKAAPTVAEVITLSQSSSPSADRSG